MARKIAVAIISIFLIFSAYRLINAENIVVGVLENKGYANVRIVDHAWFGIFHGCLAKGSRYFKAVANNKTGKEVELAVCYSLWTSVEELH